VGMGKKTKPKFKIGDWVILKKEVDSYKTALELLPKIAERFFMFAELNTAILNWKNRFMKINYVDEGSITGRCSYFVIENDCRWYEDWLEKVE
jgi:hypothetical protein